MLRIDSLLLVNGLKVHLECCKEWISVKNEDAVVREHMFRRDNIAEVERPNVLTIEET